MAFSNKSTNAHNEDKIFCSPDEENWDDGDLIDEYERKFNLLEAKLNCSFEKKKSTRQKSKWCLGDVCQTEWSEDGEIYDAEIVWIHPKRDLCRVRFLHYDNEEETALSLLLPAGSFSTELLDCSPDSYSINPLPVDPRLHYPVMPHIPAPPDELAMLSQRAVIPPSSLHSNNNARSNNSNNNFILSSSRPAGMPQSFHFKATSSGRPPKSGSLPPKIQPPNSSFISSPGNENIPFHPPFPFEADDNRGASSPDGPVEESLNDMLMSWYLCGYNTGYFQGLQDASSKSTN